MTAHIPLLLLSEVGYFVLAVLLVAIVTVLLPTLFIPIYILRFTLKHVTRTWRFDFGEILSPASTLLASDSFNVKPKEVSLLYAVVEGEMTKGDIEKLLLKMVRRYNSNMEFCYPELRQYITSWLGYYSWRHEKKFDVRTHFEMHKTGEKPEFQECELPQLAAKLLAEPFPKHQSPWKMILIRNFKSNNDSKKTLKSVILFRFHHALADAFSFTKLLRYLCDEIEQFPEAHRLHVWDIFPKIIPAAFLMPYRMVKTAFQGSEISELNIKFNSGEMFWTSHSKIPESVLSEITAHFKVKSATVVALAGLAGTLRKAFLDNEVKVPGGLSVTVSLPAHDHPDDRSVNHVSTLTINLPLGTSDPVKRLLAIEEIYSNALRDPTSMVKNHFKASIGGLYHWMAEPLATSIKSVSAIQTTHLSGPKRQANISGRRCTDMGCFVGPMMGNPGILFNIMTYASSFRFTFGIQKDLLQKFSERKIEDISSGFGKEIAALYKVRAIALKKDKVL